MLVDTHKRGEVEAFFIAAAVCVSDDVSYRRLADALGCGVRLWLSRQTAPNDRAHVPSRGHHDCKPRNHP